MWDETPRRRTITRVDCEILHQLIGGKNPFYPIIYSWLVVYLPLWKMMEFVSWDFEIPNWMESHNPFMFQTFPKHQPDRVSTFQGGLSDFTPNRDHHAPWETQTLLDHLSMEVCPGSPAGVTGCFNIKLMTLGCFQLGTFATGISLRVVTYKTNG